MKKLLALTVALSLMSMSPGGDDGDRENTNAMFKAAYLYTFTKLVDWPEEYKQGDFLIGVLGNRDLYKHLRRKYGSKRVGRQPIVLEQYGAPSEVKERCHILFINKANTGIVDRFLDNKENKTLIVTEKKGGLKRGAVINFVVKKNKLEYEVSRTNASKYELSIGSQLRELALSVE